MFLGELVDAVFEGAVFGDKLLNGLARHQLVEIANLAHQLTNLLSLSEDLRLGPGQLFLSIQRAFSPSGFDPFVDRLSVPVVAAAAADGGVSHEGSGVGVLVAEGDRYAGSLGDGPDGQPAALAMKLPDGRLDLLQFPLRLTAAGSEGGFGGIGPHVT
ncbi:hypothetical protein [Streptomyces peucetius]